MPLADYGTVVAQNGKKQKNVNLLHLTQAAVGDLNTQVATISIRQKNSKNKCHGSKSRGTLFSEPVDEVAQPARVTKGSFGACAPTRGASRHRSPELLLRSTSNGLLPGRFRSSGPGGERAPYTLTRGTNCCLHLRPHRAEVILWHDVSALAKHAQGRPLLCTLQELTLVHA